MAPLTRTGPDGCQDPFPYCATDGAESYCMARDCTATSCPTGYACQQGSDAMYCGKLPEGLSKTCASDADCSDGEANTCDTFMSHACIVTGCASGAVTCPGFYACCDVSAIVPGFSVCTPPVALTASHASGRQQRSAEGAVRFLGSVLGRHAMNVRWVGAAGGATTTATSH